LPCSALVFVGQRSAMNGTAFIIDMKDTKDGGAMTLIKIKLVREKTNASYKYANKILKSYKGDVNKTISHIKSMPENLNNAIVEHLIK